MKIIFISIFFVLLGELAVWGDCKSFNCIGFWRLLLKSKNLYFACLLYPSICKYEMLRRLTSMRLDEITCQVFNLVQIACRSPEKFQRQLCKHSSSLILYWMWNVCKAKSIHSIRAPRDSISYRRYRCQVAGKTVVRCSWRKTSRWH